MVVVDCRRKDAGCITVEDLEGRFVGRRVDGFDRGDEP
jgi:hypothetical protein